VIRDYLSNGKGHISASLFSANAQTKSAYVATLGMSVGNRGIVDTESNGSQSICYHKMRFDTSLNRMRY
jgi:hypothetical protein